MREQRFTFGNIPIRKWNLVNAYKNHQHRYQLPEFGRGRDSRRIFRWLRWLCV